MSTETANQLNDAHNAYQVANHAFREAEEYITSGELAAYISVTFPNNADAARRYFADALEDMKRKLEDRNIKIRELADLMRQRVQLAPTKWRGPDGKTDVFTLGEFKATSVTSRDFDQPTLFSQLQSLGLLERALAVTTTDKDGQAKPILKQEWNIDYEATLQWLKGNKLDKVIEAAYDEKEKTPQVKGPKSIIFLGEAK